MREYYVNSYGTKYYAYINNSSNILGLGSEVIFYDYEYDGKMNHCSIVVGTNYPYRYHETSEGNIYPSQDEKGDLIDAHTNSRLHQYWHLDEYNNYKNTTQI